MSYEVNRRSVYASASLGIGHKGLSKFCAFLNMPPPVRHDSYQMHLKQISQASVDHAQENMKLAVTRVKSTLKDGGDVSDDDDENDCDDEACVDVGVSCDGSWHRRGFSSLVGTTAVISLETGQVLDYEILNKVCYECRHWKNVPDTDPKKQAWAERHTQLCVLSITLDLLLEWNQLVHVKCGSVQKRKTNCDTQPFLVTAIASHFQQFHRSHHTQWLKLIVWDMFKNV